MKLEVKKGLYVAAFAAKILREIKFVIKIDDGKTCYLGDRLSVNVTSYHSVEK